MPVPTNTFKSRLASGDTLFGCWLNLGDPAAAELMGTAGFDWLLIDGEHGPYDVHGIRDQLIALEASPSQAVVRVPIGEEWILKQVLDLGAQSVLVPMVESGEQAARMVAACRYPTRGVRGMGSAVARASLWGGIPDYNTAADDQIAVLVQVESVEGLAALDDILAVEGLDGVFIGPADLAASMGHAGDMTQPPVQAAILDALSRIAASGKSAGILAFDPEAVARYREAGARFVAVGGDVTLLARAARSLAASYRG